MDLLDEQIKELLHLFGGESLKIILHNNVPINPNNTVSKSTNMDTPSPVWSHYFQILSNISIKSKLFKCARRFSTTNYEHVLKYNASSVFE